MPIATVCHTHKRLIPVGGHCSECASRPRRPRVDTPHTREAKKAKNRANGTGTARWHALRKARLRLARGLCEIRIAGYCTHRATTVHLDPRLGGNHRIANLEDCRAACLACHGHVDGRRSRRATA